MTRRQSQAARLRAQLLQSDAPRATVLIRIVVGGVFASEGIQKFLFPAELASGRFVKIGIPAPELMGPFVGGVEIVCGLLILAGLLTKVAAVPLLIDMLVAIASTKLPMLLGHGYWLFAAASKGGFWAFLHESRTDFSMLLGSAFLLLVGAGPWALDAALRRRWPRETSRE